MKCKYCDAELAQWGGFCPVCGKNNTPEEQLPEEEILEPVTEETQEMQLEEQLDEPAEEAVEEAVEEETDEPSPALKKSKRIAAMSGCVALLAVLATVLFFGIRGGWDVGGLFDWLKPRENTVLYKDSYTVTAKKANKKAGVVVATMDGEQLTNSQLQIYYWNEVYGFLSQNSYYLSYLGLDHTAPLDEQTCYFDQNMTWQQYFLDSALQVWQSNLAFCKLAEKEGFQLPEEFKKELETMPKELEEAAAKNGYESVDAMVQESFGPGVTLADYMYYMEVYYMGYAYFEELYNAAEPTMEQIEAYFTANEEKLTGEGIKKDGTYTVDVRHILVLIDNIVAEMEKDESQPEAQDQDKDKEEEDKYTEDQWAACLAAAQKIYDEYLAGEKTEDRFAELANKYSDDKNGKVTDGGIYTYVSEGDMVEDFNSWCFEEGRKIGDTDIVKTQFGYHVMYFVGSEETWITKTRSAYMSEQSNKIVQEALDQYTVEISYKKIALGDIAL